MATRQIQSGSKVTVDGKEYTLATVASIEDGIEQRVGPNGQPAFYNQEGHEVTQDGELVKTSKTDKKDANSKK